MTPPDPRRIAERHGHRSPERAEPRPAVLDRLRPVELDVRDDIARGEEPFARIMSAVRALADGEALALRVPFEPVPLYGVLGSRGFEHWTEIMGGPEMAPQSPQRSQPSRETRDGPRESGSFTGPEFMGGLEGPPKPPPRSEPSRGVRGRTRETRDGPRDSDSFTGPEPGGPGDCTVWFYREPAREASAPPTEIARRRTRQSRGAPRPSDSFTGSEAAPDLATIDVRGLEPPLPMVSVLERLETLAPGQTLVVIHDRRPMFLYPQLDERGFSHETHEPRPGVVRIVIRRPAA